MATQDSVRYMKIWKFIFPSHSMFVTPVTDPASLNNLKINHKIIINHVNEGETQIFQEWE